MQNEQSSKNRWVILIAGIIINISLGAGYAWSVFQAALLEAYPEWSLSQTSLAFSISFAMVPIAMIICGPIVDKKGGKIIVYASGLLFGLGMLATGFATSIPVLYITYGVILGLGIGAGYGTVTATTVKWFPDKKGLAGGLTAAGFGSGAIILSPIATQMIDQLGIDNTFKILGIVFLIVIMLCATQMSNPVAQSTNQSKTLGAHDKTYKEMLKERNFWILWAVYTIGATSGMMLIGHAANLAEYYNLGAGAFIVMIVGLANTLGRIAWGAVSDRAGRYNAVMYMLIVSITGLIVLSFSETLSPIVGILALVAIALSFGGLLGSFPGITADNWGAPRAAANYGWMFTAYGIAAIAGPSIAATIQETTGTYSNALYIAAGMSIIGLGLIIWYKKLNKEVSNNTMS